MAKLFLSFRHQDLEIAHAMKIAIERLSNKLIDVCIFPDISGSTNWRDWIERELSDSDGILFLYTDESADWRWCLYEIGVFRGVNSSSEKPKPILWIRTTDIEKAPDPLSDLQGYIANEEGLTAFFKEVVFTGNILPNYEVAPNVIDNYKALPEELSRLVRLFSPSFTIHRLVSTIDFNLAARVSENGIANTPQNTIIHFPIDEIIVSGSEAVSLLGFKETDLTWKSVYKHMKDSSRHDWLDEVKHVIEQLRSGEKETPSLQALPIIALASTGLSYRPVISGYEIFRPNSNESKNLARKQRWKKISISLVPNEISGQKLYDIRDMFDKKIAHIFSPASIVQLRIKGSPDRRLELKDIDGEAVICRNNEEFATLFDFISGENGYTDSGEIISTGFLFEKLKTGELVSSEHLNLLAVDQNKLLDDIVIKALPRRAKIPMEFTESHPRLPGKVYLPDLLCKQIIGSPSGYHKILLLVTYVEDFWPLSSRPRDVE